MTWRRDSVYSDSARDRLRRDHLITAHRAIHDTPCLRNHTHTHTQPANMSTMEKDRVSSNEVDSDDNVSSEEPPKQLQRRSKKKSKSSRRSKQAGPLDQLPLGGDAVNNTLGGITNNAVDQQKGDGGKSDTLRLRLDLNLDIEIQLKARIHGDLELALLYVNIPTPLPSSPPRASPLRFPSLLLAVSYLASTLQHRINWRLIACLPIQELRLPSLSCASVYCGRPEQGGLVPALAFGRLGNEYGLRNLDEYFSNQSLYHITTVQKSLTQLPPPGQRLDAARTRVAALSLAHRWASL